MPKRADISKILVLGPLFFVASAATSVFACSYFPPTYTVANTFTVDVSSIEGMTFAGVRVILVRGNRVSKFALTDEKGTVQFENLEPGDYSLEIDQLGIAGWDTATVKVEADRADKRNISLHWPSSPILRASDVKGMFLDSRTAKPLTETSLQLVHGLTGLLEARFLTDETGRFDFGSPQPGLYFVKVESSRPGPWEPRGEIPVLVTPDAGRDLSVALGESSCGMMYSELCTVAPSIVSHLRGTLTDDQGAVINRANIELVSNSNEHSATKIVALDVDGHFSVNQAARGDYQLRIASTGFAPFMTAVTINPHSHDTPLDVRLRILGSACTDAKPHPSERRPN